MFFTLINLAVPYVRERMHVSVTPDGKRVRIGFSGPPKNVSREPTLTQRE